MINFEKEFQNYIKVWMKKHGVSKDDYDVVDDKITEIYDEWLKIPSDVFGGKTPQTFFDNIDSPINLFKLMGKYIFSDIPVPGPLLNRMVKLKEGVYSILISAIQRIEENDKNSDKLISLCVELISEMKMPHPLDDYIKELIKREIESESAEAMINILINNVETIKEEVKAAYFETQSEYAKDSFLDILSELDHDEDAYEYVLDCFLNDTSKSGMYAHMLSKIGNASCAEYLIERMKDPTTDYFNFCAIKEALEELGEESNIDRDFSGDKDFEYLSDIDSDKEDEMLEAEEDFDE